MSVSTVSVVLVLKKENEDVSFRLRTAFPSTFAAFREKILLKIKEDLPPGYTFTLKYKNKVENQTFELRDDEDFESVLLEPFSVEIHAFPTKISEDISLQYNPELASSLVPTIHFDCNSKILYFKYFLVD
ncbi:hypothetical protein HK096_003032 [Nowakowskiella sp. JEL0078]|nr:hypothetical protein HK096_003032 [Nowakowskiella sp. JEL0078]